MAKILFYLNVYLQSCARLFNYKNNHIPRPLSLEPPWLPLFFDFLLARLACIAKLYISIDIIQMYKTVEKCESRFC